MIKKRFLIFIVSAISFYNISVYAEKPSTIAYMSDFKKVGFPQQFAWIKNIEGHIVRISGMGDAGTGVILGKNNDGHGIILSALHVVQPPWFGMENNGKKEEIGFQAPQGNERKNVKGVVLSEEGMASGIAFLGKKVYSPSISVWEAEDFLTNVRPKTDYVAYTVSSELYIDGNIDSASGTIEDGG